MSRKKLSENFYEDEFACKCGCGIGMMNPEFINRLQSLREAFGKPMMITSGLRCLAHNNNVGGSPKSRHLIGMAADISLEGAADRHDFMFKAMAMGFRGIGIASTYVHLDLRTSQPVMWTYS